MIAWAVSALVVGAALIVIEAHVPTFGVLGVAGTALAGVGVWLLIASGGFGFEVAVPVTVGVAAVGLGTVAVTGRKVLQARRVPVQGDIDALVGSDAVVRTWDGDQGQVQTGGELWSARMAFGYPGAPVVGESVVVEQVHGLTLGVRRVESWELPC